ncbi:hypothetical protein HQ590_00345, partial [bacterium]|nr:hypothetical protein [bacterium]
MLRQRPLDCARGDNRCGADNRRLAALVAVLILYLLTPLPALAQTPAPTTSANPLSDLNVIERVHTAIDRGLEYMASRQREDGGWANNNAINGLACLA